MFSSRRKSRLLLESIAVAAFVLVASSALARRILPAAPAAPYQLAGPEGVSLDALRPPPSPIQRMAARMAASTAIGGALESAVASVPEVPWGRWGLANVEIRPDAIRYDEGRERYVADVGGGRRAVLTWSPRIQRRIQDAVRRPNEPGEAVVVMDPTTGRVLAMVSDGSSDASGKNLARRAYAWAASTFKVITAAALFENTSTTPQTQTCFHGGGDGFNLEMLRDDPALDTLCVSFTRAMALSANVVFGKLADRHLNADKLNAIADKFAYNDRIPFEMEVDISAFDAPQGRIDFAMAAAGFRHSKQSPLHGALIQAAIANDGVMMVPTMVEYIEDADGTRVWEHTPVEWRRSVSSASARQLREVQSTTTVNGTARADFSARPGWPATITSWGKTGTLLNRRADGSLPERALMYRWYTGISQRGEREIVVSALVVQNPAWEITGTYLASEAVLAGLPAAP